MRRIVLLAPLIAISLAPLGCSVIVPGPDDFTYEGSDAGTDAGPSEDAGDEDAGRPDAGGGDAGPPADAGPCGVCGGTTPVCNPATGMCVECLGNEECDDGDNCTVDRCGLDNTCSSTPDDMCVAEVVAGGAHACARRATGVALCWGLNVNEQLGNPPAGASGPLPVQVVSLLDASDLSAGGRHSCAVRRTGEVVCWGWNQNQQLGNGMTTDSATPVAVTGVAGAVQVSAGQSHACAVLSGGGVMCWGRNNEGQLGSGALGADSTALMVVDVTDAVEVAGGELHTCVRRSGGTVACWGANYDGQLGDGTFDRGLRPVPVPGLTDVVSISAAAFHTCAVQMSGQVRCWGFNGDGQLGDGSDVSSESPVLVSGLNDAVAVSVWQANSCAVRRNGEVMCWGDNERGQLGNGSSGTGMRSFTPVTVSGVVDADIVSVGTDFACARREMGDAVCWGFGNDGQLGDGMSASRSTPAPVQRL